MIKNGYASRNIPSFQKFEETYHTRISAKKNGDSTTANSLKLILNTCYGATLNKYNDLFDPLQARSVCISGQLYLSELANHLYTEIPDLKVVSLNTDGIMIEFDDTYYESVIAITNEWQSRTGFELEEDKISKIIQKDVNNYCLIMDDGKVKTKGGYLVRGIAKAGAFNINSNATIIAKALVEYFVNGTPVEQTINDCNDIFQFQIIAKAGTKYKEAYHIVDDAKVPVQKVNRVYASKDKRYGKLFKVKAENNSIAKIESLPEHCIIDNDNHLTIADVDKEFYITVAQKRVNDFLGIKEIKKGRKPKMATAKKETTEKLTFVQKLFNLQTIMDEYEWEKDGKNMHQSYKFISEKQYKHFFKSARRRAGLLWECECVSTEYIPNISDKMHLVKGEFVGRLTDPDTGEYREYRFVGTGADNGDKALYKAYTGGLKFFLANQYLVAEGNDPEFDEESDRNVTEPKMSTKPATDAERKEIKKDLTDAEGDASSLQLNQLKKALKMLRETDPTQETFIAQVAEATQNFTKASKSTCEKLMLKIGEMIDNAEVA